MQKMCTTNLLFVVFLALLCQLVAAFAAQAEDEPERLELSVGFDLDRHALRGRAALTQAADDEIVLRIGDLVIDTLRFDGAAVPVAASDGLLRLAAPKAPRRVEVEFSKTYNEAGGGDSMIAGNGIVLLDTWYPVPNREVAVALSAAIPQHFHAISEAEEVQVSEREGVKQVVFSFPHPLPFVHFIAGPYELNEETLPGGTVLATYFFSEERDLEPLYRERARGYLQRYEKLIGPYPYRRYSVVENRLPTGYAMPTFTLLGQSVVRLPFITETSLGHEVLHSWFGNAVGVDYSQGNWCEGLTTYLADYAFAEDKGEGTSFRKAQLVKYQSVVPQENTMTVADFVDPGDFGTASLAQRAVGYNKASMIFHMLRSRLGDEAFFSALRMFYVQKRFQRASWDDLRQAFAAAAEVELDSFFEQWLRRADVADLSVEKLDLSIKEGLPHLSFELVQHGKEPYHLTLPLLIEIGEDQLHEQVNLQEARTPVSLSLSALPTGLVIDPDYTVMRKLGPGEMPPVLSRFIGGAGKLAVIEKGKEELFAPLRPQLEEMGCRVVSEEELDDKELISSHLMLLGTGSRVSRGLFAVPKLPTEGFTIEVRPHPLAPKLVAVLLVAGSNAEVQAAAHKLRHYGKYGYLHFTGGRIQEKRIPSSEAGLRYRLDEAPAGAPVADTFSFDRIMERVADSRVVYVGETHVSQSDHLLQYRVLQALLARKPKMALGMEMFPHSAQEALDAFVRREIDEREFLLRSHYFTNWGYDYRYYRDLLQFARTNAIPVVALNLERDVVSNAFRQDGIAGLSKEVRAALPQERDLSLQGYHERLSAVFGHHSGPHFQADKMANFVQAQALWDETMAETIAEYLRAHPDFTMLVIAGSGHVRQDNAIPPRVARRLDVRQSVLVNSRDGEMLDGVADYVFFSPPLDLPLSPKLGVMLEEKEEGVVIAGFSPHGGAKKAELLKDDIIVGLDGAVVSSVEEIKIALLYKEQGEKVVVRVRRPIPLLPDAELDFEVEL